MRRVAVLLGSSLTVCVLLGAWWMGRVPEPGGALRPDAIQPQTSSTPSNPAIAPAAEAEPPVEGDHNAAPGASASLRAAAPGGRRSREGSVDSKALSEVIQTELLVVDGATDVALEGARIRWAGVGHLWIVDPRVPGIERSSIEQILDSQGEETTTDSEGLAIIRLEGGEPAHALVEHEGLSRLVRIEYPGSSASDATRAQQKLRLFRERSLRIEVADVDGEPQGRVRVGVRMNPTPVARADWLWVGWTRAEGAAVIERVDELLEPFHAAMDEGSRASQAWMLTADFYSSTDPNSAVAFSPFLGEMPRVRLVLPAGGVIRVRVLGSDGEASHEAGWATLMNVTPGSEPDFWGPYAGSTLMLERGLARFSSVPMDSEFTLEVRLDESQRTLRRDVLGPTDRVPEVEEVIEAPRASPQITARILDSSGAALASTWVAVNQSVLEPSSLGSRSGADPPNLGESAFRWRSKHSTVRTDAFGTLTLSLAGEFDPDVECTVTFEYLAEVGGEPQRATLTFSHARGRPGLSLGNVRLEAP